MSASSNLGKSDCNVFFWFPTRQLTRLSNSGTVGDIESVSLLVTTNCGRF
jgi:hypothetical protein